jgi:hypothetical protein
LRHRARAITVWDYERLVLEAFPDIYKVKCLNHTHIDDGIYSEAKPGHVSVITIPSLKNRNDIDPLRPYTNQNRLLEIQEYLGKKISCNVKLHVTNPRFEEVRMELQLKLTKGFDDFTFYAQKLREEITSFLSPWINNSDVDIEFGGKIYKSTIINFIEERNYVDFITEVKMFHRNTDGTEPDGDQEEITAATARSILVSAPAVLHKVEPYLVEDAEAAQECPDIHFVLSEIK